MADKRTLKFVTALETKQFQKGVSIIKGQLASLGRFVKTAFSLTGIVMFGKSMVQAGKDYQDAMARVQAVSNATESEFSKMDEAARKFGRTTIYSAQEAASALEYLTRNGMSATKATESLGAVLKLAQANAIPLAEAADMLTNVMNMFGLSTKDNERIIDVLSSTASNTATNVSQLYQAMVNAAPAAKVLNFSLEEVSAALGALAQRGVKAELAGTQLRMALVKMADPNIVEKMNAMGVAINEEQMKAEGLLGTVNRLREAHLSFSDLVGIFSQKGAVGVQQLINVYGDFERTLGVVENAAGTSTRMFEQGVGSVRKELDILKNKWNDFLISVMNGGGIIRAAVRLFQNLIDNFKTTAGTLLNLASVVVPLLAGKINSLARVFKAAFTKIQTDAIATKVAIGDIIGVVITLVTWVGTALYGAWQRNTQAMRDANKQMVDAQSEAARLQSKTDSLISKLGPNTDKKTLGGVVKQLTEMFPDFSEAIRNAADEAQKTGNWEAFRDLLREIVGLQGQALALDANKAIRNAAGESIGTGLSKAARRVDTGIYARGGASTRFVEGILDDLKKQYPKTYKSYIEPTFKTIGNMIAEAGGDLGEAAKQIKPYLEGLGVDTGKYDTTETVSRKFKGGYQLEGVITRNFNDALINAFNKDIGFGLSENIQTIRTASGKIDELTNTIENSGLTNGNGGNGGSGGGGGGNGGGSDEEEELTGDLKTVSDTVENYKRKTTELNNQLKAGTITQKEYDKEMASLEDSTYKALTAISDFGGLLEQLGNGGLDNFLSGQWNMHRNQETIDTWKKQWDELLKYAKGPVKGTRDTRFDYTKTDIDKQKEEVEIAVQFKEDYDKIIKDLQEAIDKGDFSLIKGDATKMLENYKKLLKEASDNAEILQHKLNFAEAIKKIDDQIKEMNKDLSDSVKSIAQGFERVYDAVVNVIEKLGGDIDEDVKKKWEGFFAVINGGVQLMEVMKSVTEAVTLIQELQAKKKAKEAAMQVAANTAVATSETAKATAETAAAAAGAASSQAAIPIVGPALAVAAVAAVIAAIMAGAKKFATGGIIGGHSYSGDKQLARVNSGEMILNGHQQATLWNMLNGKGSTGGGNVNFRIKGADLVGTLDNYSKMRNGK